MWVEGLGDLGYWLFRAHGFKGAQGLNLRCVFGPRVVDLWSLGYSLSRPVEASAAHGIPDGPLQQEALNPKPGTLTPRPYTLSPKP